MALDYQSTGYTGANVVYDPAAITAVSESFNKADGALGPSLTWTEEVFNSQPFSLAVVSNQARYFTDQPGAWEDIQVPSPNFETPNTQLSFDFTNVTRTGTGNYHLSAGVLARYHKSADGTDYSGYAAEIGRGNILFAPAELYVLIIWRVTSRFAPAIITFDPAPMANVTLPGTFTFTANGPDLSASFTHAGPGPTLTCSATDTTFTDGTIALGMGNTISGTDSGSVTIDNFAATGDDANVAPDPRGFLWVRNTDASPKTVAVTVPGKTFSVFNPDAAVTVPAGEQRMIGPLVPELATVSGGRPLVAVNYSPNVTGVSAAAVRVP